MSGEMVPADGTAGACPDCGRPAHYVSAPGRSEGWHHDSRFDSDTCWAGKAAYEAGRIGQSRGDK
jgi:hypothetical protein